MLERALEARGWAVTRLSDARALAAGAARAAYDVILVALDGNDTDALELLIRLAGIPHKPPVLLLTHRTRAASFSDHALAALGVSRLLAWPCRVDPIAAAIEDAWVAARAATTRPEQLVS